jgi:heme-degrading monooxygenase HmoA
MIVRIFRARAHPDQVGAFELKTRTQSLATIMKDTPGLVGWFGARPLDEDEREFVMITIWSSFDALRAYAGEDWNVASLPEEDRALLASVGVDHYAITSGDFDGRSFTRA